MPLDLQAVRSRRDGARSAVKKGDALRKVGREDAAREAYQRAIPSFTEALTLFDEWRAGLPEGAPSDADTATAQELVETLGAFGGLHQRLGDSEGALEHYTLGAQFESRFRLTSTYNRLNALKQNLMLGRKRLQELDPEIEALGSLIESNLRTDKVLSDMGWAWADLGDCLALRGRPAEAQRAYATFIAKAEIKSPARTLDVLRGVAAALVSNGDPDAARLSSSIAILETSLTASS